MPLELRAVLKGGWLHMLNPIEASWLHNLGQLVTLVVPVLSGDQQVLHAYPQVDELGHLGFRPVDLEPFPEALSPPGSWYCVSAP